MGYDMNECTIHMKWELSEIWVQYVPDGGKGGIAVINYVSVPYYPKDWTGFVQGIIHWKQGSKWGVNHQL